MKIFVLSKMSDEALSFLSNHFDVSYLPEDLSEAEIAVIRGNIFANKSFFDSAPNLKLLIRAGVGLDNVDLEEAKRRRVVVENTPLASVNAVAEHTVGLMLALLRHIAKAHCSMLEDRWIKNSLLGEELKGKIVGILGYGNIGHRVAELLKPFDVTLLTHSRRKKDFWVPLEELFERSDIVSIHLPLTKETEGLVNSKLLSKMKFGSFLINTARGEIVDESDLYAACKTNLAGAALDVFSEEPYFGKLRDLDNVLLSCHLGGYTRQAQLRIAQEIVKIITLKKVTLE